MADATVSRPGQIQGAGDATALFLKVFTGEVLTAFEYEVKLKDKHRTRAISSGKSAQFPATFRVGTHYHTPGVEILGDVVKSNEIIITIDNLLIADVFIANIDEAMSQYDFRGPYSTEMGRALALAYDRNVARNILLAARGAELFTGDGGGAQLTNANFATDSTALGSALFTAKQTMEEKQVPVDSTQVWAAFKPAQWYLLAQDSKVIDVRLGGDGGYAKGSFDHVAGLQVIKSNALPFGYNDTVYNATSNASGTVGAPAGTAGALDADFPTKYQGDWTNTVGMVWTEAAAGTVQLMGLGLESDRDIRRQGTLMVGKYAVGHGPLRNKCAVEMKTA